MHRGASLSPVMVTLSTFHPPKSLNLHPEAQRHTCCLLRDCHTAHSLRIIAFPLYGPPVQIMVPLCEGFLAPIRILGFLDRPFAYILRHPAQAIPSAQASVRLFHRPVNSPGVPSITGTSSYCVQVPATHARIMSLFCRALKATRD